MKPVSLPTEASHLKAVCTWPRVACRPQNLLPWFLPLGLHAELLFTREISRSRVWSRSRQRWKIPSPALSLPGRCRKHPRAGARSRDSLLQLSWRAGRLCAEAPFTFPPPFLFNIWQRGPRGRPRPGSFYLSQSTRPLQRPDRGWQTFPAKGQLVNVSDFAKPDGLRHSYSTLLLEQERSVQQAGERAGLRSRKALVIKTGSKVGRSKPAKTPAESPPTPPTPRAESRAVVLTQGDCVPRGRGATPGNIGWMEASEAAPATHRMASRPPQPQSLIQPPISMVPQPEKLCSEAGGFKAWPVSAGELFDLHTFSPSPLPTESASRDGAQRLYFNTHSIFSAWSPTCGFPLPDRRRPNRCEVLSHLMVSDVKHLFLDLLPFVSSGKGLCRSFALLLN